jgi:hypothetical protein
MEYDRAYAKKNMSTLDVPKSAAASYIGSGRLVDYTVATEDKELLDTDELPYVDRVTVYKLAPPPTIRWAESRSTRTVTPSMN